MSERAPPADPVQIVQIAAINVASANSSNSATLFALASDGSIWRLQEWNPGVWEEVSRPPLAAQSARDPET